MQVTITNISASPVYVGNIYKSLNPAGFVTTRRTLSDLDRDQQLKKDVVNGVLTLGFATELGDNAALGSSDVPRQFSNATRPAPTTVPTFTFIWNTNDNALNWSDGVNWRDAAGVIT